jgi:preprotein translocase subunit Sec63
MVTGYLDNFYARLGISKNATHEEIRAAYHLAAKKFHPDSNDDPGAAELFLQIQEAYETLSDALKRAEYDKGLPGDIDVPKDVLVNAVYSREILPTINSSQLIYVLLNLMALPDPEDVAAIKSTITET